MNFYFVVVHASGIEVIYLQQKYEQTHLETTLTKIFVTNTIYGASVMKNLSSEKVGL